MNREHIRSIYARWRRSLLTGEGGQALPIALAALALGTLVVAPFLSHASTTLIGSGAYGSLINENYAADAGVEHAIWSLTDTSLASQLTNPGDSCSYPLSYQVNSFTPGINITRLPPEGGGGGSEGAITDTVLDTLVFSSYGATPSIVPVYGNIYAIAYRGPSNDGFVSTVNIAADGSIGNSVIDTLEFDTSDGYEPCIIHISGDCYAIAYRGSGNDGFLRTVNIATDGMIANSVTDTYEFDTANGYEPYITPISGNVYAITYRGTASGSSGYLITLTIATNGAITKSAIDTLTFSTTAYTPSTIPVSGNIYAITYCGPSNDGFVSTVNIAADGSIGNSVIDTLEFDTSDGYEPCIIHISGDYYAIAYRGSSNDGFLVTVNIASDGMIANSITDTYEYDTSDGYEPGISPVLGDVYAISYCGTSNRGYLITLTIDDSGAITKSAIDTLIFDNNTGYEPVILYISGNIYAIAYRGFNNNGYLTAVEIVTATDAFYLIQSTAGSSIITAKARISSDSTVKVLSWQLSKVP